MDRHDLIGGANTEHYWFASKRKLIDTLLAKTPSNKKSLILDIGAGTGSDIAIINQFGLVHVIDIDAQALDYIDDTLIAEKRVGDATALPYPDNYFDTIVAFDVLEHIPSDQNAVTEMYRTLKPGGHIVITVPACNKIFSAHDKALGHQRRYNKKMLRALFTNFEEKASGYWFFTLFLPAALSRLINKNKKPAVDTGSSMPGWVNTILRSILTLEVFLIKKGMHFPWGLTLYAIFKKPAEK